MITYAYWSIWYPYDKCIIYPCWDFKWNHVCKGATYWLLTQTQDTYAANGSQFLISLGLIYTPFTSPLTPPCGNSSTDKLILYNQNGSQVSEFVTVRNLYAIKGNKSPSLCHITFVIYGILAYTRDTCTDISQRLNMPFYLGARDIFSVTIGLWNWCNTFIITEFHYIEQRYAYNVWRYLHLTCKCMWMAYCYLAWSNKSLIRLGSTKYWHSIRIPGVSFTNRLLIHHWYMSMDTYLHPHKPRVKLKLLIHT